MLHSKDVDWNEQKLLTSTKGFAIIVQPYSRSANPVPATFHGQKSTPEKDASHLSPRWRKEEKSDQDINQKKKWTKYGQKKKSAFISFQDGSMDMVFGVRSLKKIIKIKN